MLGLVTGTSTGLVAMIDLLLLTCCLVASGDVYDSKGNRTGVIKEGPPGQYDFYDTRGNRTGSGKESPYGGSIQLFDKHGNRIGDVKTPRQDRNGPRSR